MGRPLAWALRFALCGAFLQAALGQDAQGLQWQVAAVRVDAGPLDRAPAQAALRAAVNLSFVRAEKKRFFLGCRQINPTGWNSFTILEQAAEV